MSAALAQQCLGLFSRTSFSCLLIALSSGRRHDHRLLPPPPAVSADLLADNHRPQNCPFSHFLSGRHHIHSLLHGVADVLVDVLPPFDFPLVSSPVRLLRAASCTQKLAPFKRRTSRLSNFLFDLPFRAASCPQPPPRCCSRARPRLQPAVRVWPPPAAPAPCKQNSCRVTPSLVVQIKTGATQAAPAAPPPATAAPCSQRRAQSNHGRQTTRCSVG